MSIDDYPIFDLVEQTRQSYKRVGSASLLYRNNDELWPEFTGRDLVHNGFDICELLAQDLARMPDVLGNQLPLCDHASDLISLTIGGNDLLHILATVREMDKIESEAGTLQREYAWIVDRIHRHAPSATVICTSVFDPTDGTGQLRQDGPKVPIHLLHELNGAIARTCQERTFTKFADVSEHFAGHGLSASGGERWFWKGSVIEPSARGASEIRRVWLDALGI
ncbi:MAG: hypothetical protein H0U64_03150, partial [Gemmatimonadaceae bacterium]|nr:hypothetical protein [Gemmatimonadaceae bacterium]